MGEQKRILIVDDEPNVRLMLRTALQSVGHAVTEAGDGSAALQLLRGQAPACDLVVLDLLMPRMDGMELLRRLRAENITVPVVILTAHGSIPEAVEAMKLGAIDFLTKPITPETLRRVAAEVIERQALAADNAPRAEPAAHQAAEQARQLNFDLARAKRALNLGQFREADSLLRTVIALDPGSIEANELLSRLETLKEREAQGSFRILRDWFPSGAVRGRS
jgi:DNA-binding NtrC family response regulator